MTKVTPPANAGLDNGRQIFLIICNKFNPEIFAISIYALDCEMNACLINKYTYGYKLNIKTNTAP